MDSPIPCVGIQVRAGATATRTQRPSPSEKGSPMDTDVRTSAPTTRSTPMVETTVSPPRPTTVGTNAATTMAPFLGAFFDDGIPVRLEFWDGSAVGPTDGPGTVLVRSANAINRLLWAPGELGLARAYVTGDLDMDGDIFEVLRALQTAAPPDLRTGVRVASPVVQAARQLGALRLPLARPVEEASPRGRRHSKSRDAAVISHHYDISNAFYRLVLGPSMTYSCARFVSRRCHPRGGPGGEARPGVPQTGTERTSGHAPARRGLRMGLHGPARGARTTTPRSSG